MFINGFHEILLLEKPRGSLLWSFFWRGYSAFLMLADIRSPRRRNLRKMSNYSCDEEISSALKLETISGARRN